MRMQHPTILVVDDELFFRSLYSELLVDLNCRVETVASGEEAMTRLRKGDIDLLVTDLVMTGLSGLDLLHQTRLMDNPPEVVLTTGHADVQTAVQALKAGARDYLVKPFQPDELRHIVHTCLEQRRLMNENVLLKKQIALFQRGRHLSSILDLDKLLPQAVGMLLQEMGEGRGVGFLVDKRQMLSQIPALDGVTEEEAHSLVAALLPRLQNLSVDSAELIVRTEDLEPDDTYPAQMREMVILPLHSERLLQGGIALINRPGASLPLFETDRLRFLADQVLVAFQNALLYQGARELIFIDDLTGLHNYRYLQTVLGREIRRTERYGLSFALVFIDLDYFKNVNDTYGHLAGSSALREVAGILRRSVREVDLLFRYGGDEFTALLVETDSQGAAVVAERIRRSIEEHLFLQEENLSFRLTATVGFAAFPEDARTREDVIDLADQAMYQGKKVRNIACGVRDIDRK